MAEYFSFGKTEIKDFSDENIKKMYDEGFVFTRIGKGIMNQTRSLRINLAKFELNSENRRVLGKVDGLLADGSTLPISAETYDWQIQKLAKDFYTKKLGIKTSQQIKLKLF